MADLAQSIQTAKKAGYSDAEIAAFIANDPAMGGKVKTARAAGYADAEIVAHLGGGAAPAQADPNDESWRKAPTPTVRNRIPVEERAHVGHGPPRARRLGLTPEQIGAPLRRFNEGADMSRQGQARITNREEAPSLPDVGRGLIEVVGGGVKSALAAGSGFAEETLGRGVEAVTGGQMPRSVVGDAVEYALGFALPGPKGVPHAAPPAPTGIAGLAGDYARAQAGRAASTAGQAVRKAGGAIASPVVRAADPFVARVSRGAAEKQAGRRIAQSATDEAAVRASLEADTPPLVPGSEPTTYQLTGDAGLGQLEREAQTRMPAEFLARTAEQDVARTRALEGVQSGGDPAEVSRMLKERFDALDAEHAAAVERATASAQERAAAMGGTASAEDVGAQIRTATTQAEQSARASESALWNQLDPDGTLTGNVTATKAAAREIPAAEASTAKPIAGEEAAIFEAAASLPDVAPIRDLTALRSRVSTAMREELRASGRTPVYARLSRLRGQIEDNLAGSISERVALESEAVARGELAAEDAIFARLQADRAGWSERVEARAATGGGDPGYTGGRASGVSGFDRAEVSQGGGARPSSGGPRLSSDADLANATADIQAWRTGQKGSLFRAIQELGGLRLRDPNGVRVAGPDVSAYLGDVRVPGLVNNRSGLPPEQMAQALADRGWFGPAVGDPARAFEAAVASEARGAKNFAAGSQAPDAAAIISRTDDEARLAGVRVSDRPDVAARKLADWRASQSDIRRRAEAAGIENADRMTPDELLAEIQEREAIRAESGVGAAHDPYAAEFDRLSGPKAPTVDAGFADRLTTASDATKARSRTFGAGPVRDINRRAGSQDQFTLPAAVVPGRVFVPGPKGATNVKAVLDASPDAIGSIEEAAALSLRQHPGAIRPDGTVNPRAFEAWRNRHQSALSALPPETQARLADAASAGEALAEAQAARATATKEANSGALGRLMGVEDGADVTKQVGTILGGNRAVADISALAKAARGDPGAQAGLRQALADHMAGRVVSNTEAGASGVDMLRADGFQTYLRRNRKALGQAFTPEELQTFDAIAADLKRSARSQRTKLPGQSNTAQDMAGRVEGAVRKYGARSMLDLTMAGLGFATHGPVGMVAAPVVTEIVGAFRASGINRVEDLVARAMLDPDLAKALLRKVKVKADGAPDPASMAARIKGLVRALQAAAAPAASVAGGDLHAHQRRLVEAD